MKEDFVPYEIAVKLRKKGFNIDTDFCYNQDGGIVRVGTYPAPRIHEVLKWLREEKGWVIVVRLYSTNGWYWFIQDEKGELKSSHLASCDDCFATYELAAIAGIEYVIDNLI